MELIGLLVIVWQARWCARTIDPRQPLARWGSVGCLGLSWLLNVAGEFWGSAIAVVLAWLMVMYALNAKSKWAKKQEAGG